MRQRIAQTGRMKKELPHRFRLDDFDIGPRVTAWETLPPIAAHIRWIKKRIDRLLPDTLTVDDQMRFEGMWQDLVDSEAATWRDGHSPHGWFSWQPQGYRLPVKPIAGATDGHAFRDEEDDDPWDVIDVPSSTHTEVLTASFWFDEVEDTIHLKPKKYGSFSFGDAYLKKSELAVFLSVLAAHRTQDAEGSLICGESQSVAWHCITEATELVNRAERLNRLLATRVRRSEQERSGGRFHISEVGTVLIELNNERYLGRPRNGGKGFSCIQTILKEPLLGVDSETLAVGILGHEVTVNSGEAPLPFIEPDEIVRIKVQVADLKRKRDALDEDADDYEPRRDEIDGDLNALEWDLRDRMFRGRSKLTLGPKQRRNRRVGAILDRTIKLIMKSTPGIGAHFHESLKYRNGDRPAYAPSEKFHWCFDAPEDTGTP